jgi:tetratricopeptide (TPR) repeat protein
VAAVSLWRNQRLREKNLHVVVIGLAFLAAHLVQNVTVFENPTSYLYFIFWLAFINSLTRIFSENANQDAGHPTETKGTIDKKIGLPLLSIIFSLAVALIYIFNWQPARANMQTFSALNALYRDPMSGLAVAREVLNFSSPHIDDIRSDLSRAALQLLNSSYQRMGKEKSIEFLDVFYNNLQKNVSLHPLDIRNQISLASLSQLGWMISQDGKYVYEGKKYLEEAAVYSPRRQQILYMLSMFKLQVGETDSAIKLLEQTIRDDSKISEGYWRLAHAYLVSGQTDKAKEIFLSAEKNGMTFEGQGAQIRDLVFSNSSSKSGQLPKK